MAKSREELHKTILLGCVVSAFVSSVLINLVPAAAYAFAIVLMVSALSIPVMLIVILVDRLRGHGKAGRAIATPAPRAQPAAKALVAKAPEAPMPDIHSRNGQSYTGGVPAAAKVDLPTDRIIMAVARADDAVVAMREYVRQAEAQGDALPNVEQALVTLIRRCGVIDRQDMPPVSATAMMLTHRIDLEATDATPEQADMLDSCEGAFNLLANVLRRLGPAGESMTRNQLLAQIKPELDGFMNLDALGFDKNASTCPDADLCRVKPGGRFDKAFSLAYGNRDPKVDRRDWDRYYAEACFMNTFPFPHSEWRSFEANPRSGVALCGHAVVRPGGFAYLEAEDGVDRGKQLTDAALAYEARVALRDARMVFANSDRIRRVFVFFHEGDDTLLSLSLDEAALARLMKVMSSPSPDLEAFAADDAVHLERDASGRLVPIKPHIYRYSPELNASYVSRTNHVCPDDLQPLSPRLAELVGGKVVADLQESEYAPRERMFDRMISARYRGDHSAIEGMDTADAVAYITKVGDGSSDITVLEACTRLCRALVDGTLSVEDVVEDRNGLATRVFIYGSPLYEAMRRVEDEKVGEPEGAQRVLDALLPVLSTLSFDGDSVATAYLDDSETVYRWFRCQTLQRIHFNLGRGGDARACRIVPDSYRRAQSFVANALVTLGRLDEALAHADELARIAPYDCYHNLQRASILDDLGRTYEAADVVRKILPYSDNPQDATRCLCDLAFYEWKLARTDLAVACSWKAAKYMGGDNARGKKLLKQILDAAPEYKGMKADECDRLMKEEGVSAGFSPETTTLAFAAAMLCVDDGLFWSAHDLIDHVLSVDPGKVLHDINAGL